MPNIKTTTAKDKFFKGVGRRKSAVAQVRIMGGNGIYVINEKELETPKKVSDLLILIDRNNQLDISAIVRGGGMISQVDAVTLGVARALLELNPDLRKTLRKAGYLTRDPRVKERKKPGLKRARRAPQWSKR